MTQEITHIPTRGELSRALRLAHEQLFQLWQMFHHLVADESDARTQKYIKELARKNNPKQ